MSQRTYDLDFYSFVAIQNAIQAFDGIAIITASRTGNMITCTFSLCRYSVDETMNEFDNYVLNASASSRLKDDCFY